MVQALTIIVALCVVAVIGTFIIYLTEDDEVEELIRNALGDKYETRNKG